MWWRRARAATEILTLYVDGVQRMTSVAVMLVLAWALGQVNGTLGTASFLIEIARGTVPPELVPAVVFLAGAVLSFATGSSWGTFAIMLPVVVPMAAALSAPEPVAIGAVIAGGLFGDHVSPISDSTILCSTGAGCDHVDHVVTQLPYALVNALIALAAFVVAGFAPHPGLAPAAVVTAIAVYMVLGRRAGVRIPDLAPAK